MASDARPDPDAGSSRLRLGVVVAERKYYECPSQGRAAAQEPPASRSHSVPVWGRSALPRAQTLLRMLVREAEVVEIAAADSHQWVVV